MTDHMNDVDDLFADERRKVKEDEAKAALKEKSLLQAIYNLMELEDGREFMWWLLEQTHYFQTSFTGNSVTYFREGERNIGNKVLEKLFTVRPQAMQELIEHHNREKTHD